jgi:hypothetical protein
MLLNPAVLTSSNVAATTGALFQDPSSGTASKVFPKFHPGLMAATYALAEMDLKVVVHDPVGAADVVDDLVELLVTVLELDTFVEVEVLVEELEPGPSRHW